MYARCTADPTDCYLLVWATDGRCSIMSSRQSAATSEIIKHCRAQIASFPTFTFIVTFPPELKKIKIVLRIVLGSVDVCIRLSEGHNYGTILICFIVFI